MYKHVICISVCSRIKYGTRHNICALALLWQRHIKSRFDKKNVIFQQSALTTSGKVHVERDVIGHNLRSPGPPEHFVIVGAYQPKASMIYRFLPYVLRAVRYSYVLVQAVQYSLRAVPGSAVQRPSWYRFNRYRKQYC